MEKRGLLSEQYRLNRWLPSLSILRKQFFFEEIIFEECRGIFLRKNLFFYGKNISKRLMNLFIKMEVLIGNETKK
jgi:hypothetical protein